MRFYLGDTSVRLPAALVRHLPRRWVSYSFSVAETARIQREAARRADELRELCD